MNCTIRVAKRKALISFAVTAAMISAFVFAYMQNIGFPMTRLSFISASLTCIQCLNIPLPRDCGTVKKCGAHEVCFIEMYATASGAVRYNMGCRDTQFCIKSSGRMSLPNNDINTDLGDITKLSHNDSGNNSSGDSADDVIVRSSSDVKVCDSCCSGDLCNNAGCGATGYPAKRGPVCYTCAQHISPDSCDTISLCGLNSVCKVRLNSHPTTGDVYYTSQCEDPQVCHQDAVFQNSIVGRKRLAEEVNTATNKCLVKCCDGDLCTGSCGTGSISGTIGTTTRTIINHCTSNPCGAHGTCHPSGSSFTCTCAQGWIGPTCYQNAVSSSQGCFLGWVRHGSSCYLFVSTKADWNHAQDWCRIHVSYLAEVNDSDEQNFLVKEIALVHKGDFWVGGTFISGRWIWDHSKQFLTDHSMFWDRGGYPSGDPGNCVELHEDSQGAWRNHDCNDTRGYVCEKPV